MVASKIHGYLPGRDTDFADQMQTVTLWIGYGSRLEHVDQLRVLRVKCRSDADDHNLACVELY